VDQDTKPRGNHLGKCLTPRAPYKLFALAYNLANFLRSLALPDQVAQWSLTTLREKLVKIGARIVRHGRYVAFQLAGVAVPRALFAAILRRIDRLRGPPVAAA
jgi:Transposase DDE domain group 1